MRYDIGNFRSDMRYHEPSTAIPSPTCLWRGIAASSFDPHAIAAMKKTIGNIELFNEPRWKRAVAGDPAMAVGLALMNCHERTSLQRLDVIMTSLALHALEGDRTACLVMSELLRRSQCLDGRCRHLANSWLVRAHRPRTRHGSGAATVERIEAASIMERQS